MNSNTNWNLYKSFKVVYETKNLTHASRVLNTTQQAVGQNIKELGKQLGVVLFTPTTKGVEPTEYAHTLYPEINNAVSSIIKAENTIETLNNETQAIIKIVIQTTLAEHYIKDYMKDFCIKYPNVQLQFMKHGQADLYIDIATTFGEQYKTINLFTEQGCLVATQEFLDKHNLTQNITREQLLKLPIIVRDERWHYFNQSIDAKPKLIKTMSTESTILTAKNSLGVGCVSREEFQAIFRDTDLVILDVKDVVFEPAQFVCAYKDNLSRPAKAFIDGLVVFVEWWCQ